MQDLSPDYNYEESETREVNSPFVKVGGHTDFVKDLRPVAVGKVGEEILIVPPKDGSAPGSARFSDLQKNESPTESETSVHELASKESGKDSDKSEQITTPEDPEPPTELASSSQDSSSETSPGSVTPPALDAPPTSVNLPKL